MSASLARSVFRPTPRTAQTVNKATSCPVSRIFGPAASSSTSTSARTANAIAHITVGAAVVASAVSFAQHPDPLVFDHPPRSALGLTPSQHIANRQMATAARAPASRTTSSSASPPSSPSLRSLSSTTASAASLTAEWTSDLRLAGVIGRSLSGH
ncbi:hypothetical protein Rhopal_004153-T1 [Rhodotorula paludigena]|uniref:Uncharacterized protein n=1 Tax=Rhodotorula paludigena TaxID=86838 RepID=A0AAV5GML6_9BASI|nr:hypothetical protein Rhopal_004153-T1 [Rhodotorula paludigena]